MMSRAYGEEDRNENNNDERRNKSHNSIHCFFDSVVSDLYVCTIISANIIILGLIKTEVLTPLKVLTLP